MVVVVFRTRLRPGPEEEMFGMWTELCGAATAMPGYIGHKEFQSEDGEFVTIVEFASHEDLAAWREHSRHKVAQQRGRDEWFSAYQIQVCDVVRQYGRSPSTSSPDRGAGI